MRLIRSLFYGLRACGALLMSLLTSQPSFSWELFPSSAYLSVASYPASGCSFLPIMVLDQPPSSEKNWILSLPTAPDHRIWVLQSLLF